MPAADSMPIGTYFKIEASVALINVRVVWAFLHSICFARNGGLDQVQRFLSKFSKATVA